MSTVVVESVDRSAGVSRRLAGVERDKSCSSLWKSVAGRLLVVVVAARSRCADRSRFGRKADTHVDRRVSIQRIDPEGRTAQGRRDAPRKRDLVLVREQACEGVVPAGVRHVNIAHLPREVGGVDRSTDRRHSDVLLRRAADDSRHSAAQGLADVDRRIGQRK